MATILISCTSELVDGQSIMTILENAGYKVVMVEPEAGNLQPALEIKEPDIVIVDGLHPDFKFAVEQYHSRPLQPPYWLFVTKACFPEVPTIPPNIRGDALLRLVKDILNPPKAEEEKIYEI